jgi:hypothetical protein
MCSRSTQRVGLPSNFDSSGLQHSPIIVATRRNQPITLVPSARPEPSHWRPDAPKWDLGGGTDRNQGFFASVRAATRRILVNVNVTNVAFYNDGPRTSWWPRSSPSGDAVRSDWRHDWSEFESGPPAYQRRRIGQVRSSTGLRPLSDLLHRTTVRALLTRREYSSLALDPSLSSSS